MTDKRASPLALIALFLSGAAGLIDQLAWIRRASLVFGSTTHSLSTVLAVFFLGLALGGWAFGRLSTRTRQPIRAAAFLELGLAHFVLATPFAFDLVEGLFGQAYRAAEAAGSTGGGAGLWAARAGLVALVLLPPAFLMGGTLPLFARQIVSDGRRIGGSLAVVYATNTLGAALGCAAAGYLLLPALGVRGSLAVAAGLNVAAAGLLFRLRAPALEPAPVVEPAPSRGDGPPAWDDRRFDIAWVLFLTGFVALAQEVVWARFLAAVIGQGIHTVALTLALVLIGIVLGSALVTRMDESGFAREAVLGLLLLVGAFAFWIPFHLPVAVWHGMTNEAAAAALLVLPAAVLSGAVFPLAVRATVRRTEEAGLRLGTLLAWNTAGGICGALLVGFWVLPVHGLEPAAMLCAILAFVAGVVVLTFRSAGRDWMRKLAPIAAGLGLIAVGRFSGVHFPDDHLADPAERIAVRQGLESNLAVVRGTAGERVLEIDRWWQGQDVKTHQAIAAHLPMLLHPDPRRVLVVGVGAGQTPASFVLHDGLERLDCADIEPAVFDVLRTHFPHAWMGDPRVRLLAVDGRNHLTHSGERYDVISLEVGQLFRPGAAAFYTLDFYRHARARLAPGGIVSQFVPIPFLHPDELQRVVATFRAVFPEATLWYNTSELLLVGAAERPLTLEPARLAAALADSAVAADLSFSWYGGRARSNARPEVLHGAFLAGPRELAALADGAAVERDDPPRLAYAVTQPAAGEPPREIATLGLVRRHLAPLGASFPGLAPEQVAAAERVRDDDLQEIATAVLLRQVEGARAAGDTRQMLALLERAAVAQPGHVRVRRMLADLFLLQGQVANAESLYVSTLAMADDSRTHGGLGLLLLTQGRVDEGVVHLRRAIELGPDDASFRTNLGAALVRQGRLREAEAEFERAQALDPALADARNNLVAVRTALAQQDVRSPFRSSPAPTDTGVAGDGRAVPR